MRRKFQQQAAALEILLTRRDKHFGELLMQTLTFNEIEQISGAINACQAILQGSGALEGFLLSGGNPAGAIAGAYAGHWVGNWIGGGCQA